MRSYKFYIVSLLTLSVLSIGLFSCGKKCKLEGENVDEGEINTEVAIYPSSGYLTNDMAPAYHVHTNDDLGSQFEISTDNGLTRTPVDYSTYSILACPITLDCNHFLRREVIIDDIDMTVMYNIEVTQCKEEKCTGGRFIENYVLVPAIPETYSITQNVEYIEQ